MKKDYVTYRNGGGGYTWAISAKLAILTGWPSSGKVDTEGEAEEIALRYIKHAQLKKANPKYNPPAFGPVVENRTVTTAPQQSLFGSAPASSHVVVAETTAPEQNEPLYLLDASYFERRSYHGYPLLYTKDGVPTNALYGFTKVLCDFIQDYRPKNVVAVFDMGRDHTWRRELYAPYKSNREDDPILKAQREPILEMVRAFGIPIVQHTRYEADDLLASVATKHPGDVVIATCDKDMMQCVTEDGRVTLLDFYNRTKVGVEQVALKFGVRPHQVPDILGLAGDTGDCIPGVPSVGPGTAKKWIQQYGSLEELLAKSGEIKGKVGEKLRENIEQAKLSKTLATVVADAPYELPKTTFEPDLARIGNLFQQYGIVSLYKYLPT